MRKTRQDDARDTGGGRMGDSREMESRDYDTDRFENPFLNDAGTSDLPEIPPDDKHVYTLVRATMGTGAELDTRNVHSRMQDKRLNYELVTKDARPDLAMFAQTGKFPGIAGEVIMIHDCVVMRCDRRMYELQQQAYGIRSRKRIEEDETAIRTKYRVGRSRGDKGMFVEDREVTISASA